MTQGPVAAGYRLRGAGFLVVWAVSWSRCAAGSCSTPTAVLASAITRIVLTALAVLATRKTLEDLPGEPAEAAKIREHRLAVLKAVLAVLATIALAGLDPPQQHAWGWQRTPSCPLTVFLCSSRLVQFVEYRGTLRVNCSRSAVRASVPFLRCARAWCRDVLRAGGFGWPGWRT